jgi:hypothetical protein
MTRRGNPASGSRDQLARAAAGDGFGGTFSLRPGVATPPGMIGLAGRSGPGLPRVSYNTVPRAGRSFPGQGDQSNPYETNDLTRRNTRVRADPKTGLRIQRGADWDPTMPALSLGLPWRPAPDAPPVRRPDG